MLFKRPNILESCDSDLVEKSYNGLIQDPLDQDNLSNYLPTKKMHRLASNGKLDWHPFKGNFFSGGVQTELYVLSDINEIESIISNNSIIAALVLSASNVTYKGQNLEKGDFIKLKAEDRLQLEKTNDDHKILIYMIKYYASIDRDRSFLFKSIIQ